MCVNGVVVCSRWHVCVLVEVAGIIRLLAVSLEKLSRQCVFVYFAVVCCDVVTFSGVCFGL